MITSFTLVKRSLTYYSRAHLRSLFGAAVSTAVLVGALVVGDSVRESLRQTGLARLGRTELALASGDRLFRSQLAADVEKSAKQSTIPVLQLPAAAAASDGSARANNIAILGVTDRFWSFAPIPHGVGEIPADLVYLNEPLARQLRVTTGAEIVLRVHKPSDLSRDAPLAPDEKTSVALRLKVGPILSEKGLANFSLQASQTAPLNAFVSLRFLQERVGATNRANLLLTAATNGAPMDVARAQQALKTVWQLADAELQLRPVPGGIELRTARVFLDPAIATAATAIGGAQPVLTYFANELASGTNSTPYSMVCAAVSPFVPADMKDDEILVHQWLADDLRAKAGDPLRLAYYVVGPMRKLVEEHRDFRVRTVLPMSGITADRTLMPDFPGMTDAANCRDWDTGFPIQTDKIREKDEKYWTDFRGTPKAFVTLKAGQAMWSNRFGNLTAIRYPGGDAQTLEKTLRDKIDPAMAGLQFEAVRARILNASAQGQDFGELFLSFSFFLMISALLLMALLFQFGIEQRMSEAGTLLALGFTPRYVRRLMLFEGSLLALLGTLPGMIGGLLYAKAMLFGLSTLWSQAINRAEIEFHGKPSTVLTGAVIAAIVAAASMALTLRKKFKQPARELQAGASEESTRPQHAGTGKTWVLTLACGAAAVVMIVAAIARHLSDQPGLFFGAGALLLVAGISAWSIVLNRLALTPGSSKVSLAGMGLRNATRHRARSRAVIILLASGSFLVAAVGVFRLDTPAGLEKRSSGTGGFALLGQSSLPVVHDLNSDSGQQFYGIDKKAMTEVSVVPLRVREGEEASCLNLNRAQKPRLLGVDPALLQQRHAFSFASAAKGSSIESGWLLLQSAANDPDVVPAIGDAASIQWALGKRIGDVIPYTDERGKTFKLKLVASVANSILQGSLLIAEKEFIQRFPSESGYRMFLMDAPSKQADAVAAALSRALQDVGLEVSRADARLAALNAVQNTYLNTFQVLGGLGVLLGSVGLGVIVLRNVHERRGEIALLQAVGFQVATVRWLVLCEHGALLLMGLAAGIAAAGAAVLPSILSPSQEPPYRWIVWTVVALLCSGLLWTWAATRLAVRGPILESLHESDLE